MEQQSTPLQPQAPAASDEKLFAAVGYIAFLFVITLIAKPKSQYCQLHAKQSMVMFLITIVVFMVLAMTPWIGSLFTLALFALYILAIYRAFRGDYWKIPFISNLADKINLGVLYQKSGLKIEQIGGLKEKAGEQEGENKSGVQ